MRSVLKGGSLSVRLTTVVVLSAVLATACSSKKKDDSVAAGSSSAVSSAAPSAAETSAAAAPSSAESSASAAPAAPDSSSASSSAAESSAADTSSSASGAAPAAGAATCKPEEIKLVVITRDVTNPYEALWDQGGKAFAKTVNLEKNYQLQVNGGDSQKQLTQLQATLAQSGKCTVVNIDPNASSDTESVVKTVKDAGGVVVTQWNKADDQHPWDIGDAWLAHFSFDGNVGGYEIAKAMFEKMGKKGNIVALQGILDNVPAKQRYAGLQKALKEYPDIKMLDQQTAEWATDKALAVTKTWLTKYGDKIDGIWAANDGMALGATEALRAVGKAGKIPVVGTDAAPEAVQHVKNGEQVATVVYDGFWQGGVGLAMGYQVLTGKVDVKSLDHTKREFFAKQALITKDNVDQYLAAPDPAKYEADWKDPWNRVTGPITY